MTILNSVLMAISGVFMFVALLIFIKQIIKRYASNLETGFLELILFFSNLIFVFIGNSFILSTIATVFMAGCVVYFTYVYFKIEQKTTSDFKKEFSEMINDFLVFYHLK